MPRYFLLWAVLIVIVAGLGGYLLRPRYQPPAESGEARLRQRAVEFYRAQCLVDYGTIARLYTPARQVDEQQELRAEIDKFAETVRHFQPDTLSDLAASAETVTADALEVEIDGDWAVTAGERLIVTEGYEIPTELDQVVWVRNGGDWWIYTMTQAELIAYGNPPDFARKLVFHRPFTPVTVPAETPPAESGNGEGETEATEQKAADTEPAAETADEDAAAAENGEQADE